MTVRFLLDENITPLVRDIAVRAYPQLDIACIGDAGCPPKGTGDEDILRFVSQSSQVLITRNRKSMPRHVSNIEGQGITHWGVFQVREGTTLHQLVEQLHLLAEASEPTEWVGKQMWIPM